MVESNPIDLEKALFTAVESHDLEAAEALLSDDGRTALELTGRCFAHAITHGNTEMALLLGRAGCCLNVLDEPAVVALLESGEAGMRGLVGFLQRYRYCKAQRTYYLSVVQAPASVEPVRALLAQGAGLTTHDQAELLSLSIRQDNVELARCLVEGGAQLIEDIHDAVPDDLLGKAGVRNAHSPWVEQLSPQSGKETILFVLEQVGDAPCPVRAAWFKLYFRDPLFADKLALIAPHSNAALCEDTAALLETLARAGHARAIESVLTWDGLDVDACAPALAAAQDAGHIQIAAALLERMHTCTFRIEPLSF